MPDKRRASQARLGAGGVRAETAGSGEPIHTATPIRHYITLMQENHSFDNYYFGTYPGADGLPPKTCISGTAFGTRAVRLALSHRQ